MHRSVRPVTWGQGAESPGTAASGPLPDGALVSLLAPPCFDDHLCLGAGGEPFEAQALVAELAVKLSVTPFSQACRGSINAVPMPCATVQDTLARHLQPCRPP